MNITRNTMEDLINIAVKVDSKEQWEQVAAVLESYGMKKDPDKMYNDWDCRIEDDRQNNYVLDFLQDGFGLYGTPDGCKSRYTFSDFMQKYGNEPAPTDLEQRLLDLECKVGEIAELLNQIRERL